MPATTFLQRSVRPIRPKAVSHLFAVGQTVRLQSNARVFAGTAGLYRITGTLPPSGGSPQYRIRNDDERHERVTTQDNLEPVELSDGGETLERTFDHGQGTKRPTGVE